jgi:CDP-diacylglycerol--glycerol-3-phosphate 3-phosphatidyltransferase
MLRHLPNLLSAFRLVMVPVLLGLAWYGRSSAFLCAFAAALASDVADGYVARKTGTSSVLGAKLDSWGDLSNYLVLPVCAWWLWPERILAQLTLVAIALVAFLVPTLVGLLKFRRLTSYHTRAAKACAIVMGAGLLLYLGAGLVWMFQLAVLLLVVEAIEEIAITAVLREWRADVPSIFAALRSAKTGAPLALLALLPGLAVAQALPDLVPEVSDVHFEYDATVPPGDVAEGCASATDGVDLLRLALTTRNAGPADLTIGDPQCPDCAANPGAICGDPEFICSPAGGHNHPHYGNFLRYELIDGQGAQVGLGGKRSFCLAESSCLVPPASYHTCGNQGLSAGCYDIYPSYLGCQYIEITGVPSGSYTLRVTVDPGGQIAEADEANNVIERPVEITRAGDADVMLEGGKLKMVPGKLLRLSARRVRGQVPPTVASDPTTDGAILYLFDLGNHADLGIVLPAGGWRRAGGKGSGRYVYRGQGSDNDPCRSVVVTRKAVHATCRGTSTGFPLPARGEIFVQLVIGESGERLCASFGGKTLRNTAERLVRRNPPPSTCNPIH